jgi:hypothetical protein
MPRQPQTSRIGNVRKYQVADTLGVYRVPEESAVTKQGRHPPIVRSAVWPVKIGSLSESAFTETKS